MASYSLNITKSLLSAGYFPKELPPVFTTTDFGANAKEIIAEWKDSGLFSVKPATKFRPIKGKIYSGRYGYEKVPAADPEILSTPKRRYERRNLHITHPIPQALLALEIGEHWAVIQKWLSRRRYSEDKIDVSRKYDRAVKELNFQIHRAKTNYIGATADLLVKTDITRFYPSIYTHSIAWAAYGKERVKRNIATYDGSLADRLDLLVRSCNRNQTIGIPIGPETSRIIAEIISSRIDAEFEEASKKRVRTDSVDRLQDDWIVGANSLEHAETILSVISKCYRDYGLEINGSKTSVTHVMASKEEGWKSEISSFLSHDSMLFGSRLRDFLSLCLKLQIEAPGETVLNYALPIIEGMRVRSEDFEALESFLLKAASLSPISMDRICRIIINLDRTGGGLSKDRLKNRFVELAERCCENGANYELLWLLYTLRGIKAPFRSKRITEFSEHVQSSSIRLLLLDMQANRLVIPSLPKSSWEKEISGDRIGVDWTWLYSYESVRRGWLTGPSKLLSAPFFKPMHDRDVVFYDPRRNVKRSSAIKKINANIRRRQQIEASSLIRLMRKMSNSFEWESEY